MSKFLKISADCLVETCVSERQRPNSQPVFLFREFRNTGFNIIITGPGSFVNDKIPAFLRYRFRLLFNISINILLFYHNPARNLTKRQFLEPSKIPNSNNADTQIYRGIGNVHQSRW